MDQLRSLRVFVQVIKEGSFAGAARTLDLAPAVVTRAVAELEQHLGARLLNRTTRRLALTEIGQAYLERARRILAELDDADALAGASTKQPRGSLRIVCPPAFAVHQLARHLPRFRAKYPQVGLEVATPGPVDMADENFDVSIVSVGQQALQGDFIARRLARSTFVVCASPAYLERRGRPAHPDELLQHDGVLPAVSAVRRELTLYRSGAADGKGRGSQSAAAVTIPTPPPALSTSHIDMILAAGSNVSCRSGMTCRSRCTPRCRRASMSRLAPEPSSISWCRPSAAATKTLGCLLTIRPGHDAPGDTNDSVAVTIQRGSNPRACTVHDSALGVW
jgi:DNA-binding transcriptional LysR family regulator